MFVGNRRFSFVSAIFKLHVSDIVSVVVVVIALFRITLISSC